MNLPKSENAKLPQCPEEKEKAITKRVERYRDMSNTIAHLAVARELLKKCPNLIHNERAYYLGILAPDTIGGKPDSKREDKKKVHLHRKILQTRAMQTKEISI